MKMRSVILTVLAALALAACGSNGSSGSQTQPSRQRTGGRQSTATVSVRSVSGRGSVLVDAKGMTLYTPDQEAGGMITCTGSCTQIWHPLVAGSAAPSAVKGVPGKLGTIDRPDGSHQVALDGKPLYTFELDKRSGDVKGDKVTDSFGGHQFRWHAVKASGTTSPGGGATTGGKSTSTTGSGGYGY